MSIETDKELAIKIAVWLGARTEKVVNIKTLDTGVFEVAYYIGVEAQPPARVEHGKVVFPKGTNFELMMDFLGS